MEKIVKSADMAYQPNSPIFYNPAQTLSYNYKVNMVCSMRGPGKTFGTLVMLINRFLKYGEQFIYLRRTQEELKECKNKLFDDIKAKEVFPGVELKCDGKQLLCDKKTWVVVKPSAKPIKLNLSHGQKLNGFSLMNLSLRILKLLNISLMSL